MVKSSSPLPSTICFLLLVLNPLFFTRLFSRFLASPLFSSFCSLIFLHCVDVLPSEKDQLCLFFVSPPFVSTVTPLSHPPTHPHPRSPLFVCVETDRFRQASSYQATAYMLIGSIPASLFLSETCMGLTAVMFRWLLMAWCWGWRGRGISHFLLSVQTFAQVLPAVNKWECRVYLVGRGCCCSLKLLSSANESQILLKTCIHFIVRISLKERG